MSRNRSKCPAVAKGEVKSRGRASLEYYTTDGKGVYYCIGYIDNQTEELMDTCSECRQNVKYAQEDLDAYVRNANESR